MYVLDFCTFFELNTSANRWDRQVATDDTRDACFDAFSFKMFNSFIDDVLLCSKS